MADSPPGRLVAALIAADSITSEVAHRHGARLPFMVKADLVRVSGECRALAEALGDRNALAAVLAQAWCGDAYVGDLAEADWERWYRVVDELLGEATDGR